VEHRPEFERGLQVAEAAFGFEQVLVAQRGVIGGVAGGKQVLAVMCEVGATDSALGAGKGRRVLIDDAWRPPEQ
jgi:hypothetical protein